MFCFIFSEAQQGLALLPSRPCAAASTCLAFPSTASSLMSFYILTVQSVAMLLLLGVRVAHLQGTSLAQ